MINFFMFNGEIASKNLLDDERSSYDPKDRSYEISEENFDKGLVLSVIRRYNNVSAREICKQLEMSFNKVDDILTRLKDEGTISVYYVPKLKMCFYCMKQNKNSDAAVYAYGKGRKDSVYPKGEIIKREILDYIKHNSMCNNESVSTFINLGVKTTGKYLKILFDEGKIKRRHGTGFSYLYFV